MGNELEPSPAFHSTADAENEKGHKYLAGAGDEVEELHRLGYEQEMNRNRSVFTLLFQMLSIAAIPYCEGSALINAIYGGGPLCIFVGWIVVCVLDQSIAFSLAELSSRYPTSAGPYYWTFQIAKGKKWQIFLSFLNGWIWLIGNWTITLSINFGFASLLSASISMYHPNWTATNWELLMFFFAICLLTMLICIFANRWLPKVDIVCAIWITVSIVIFLICLSVKAGAGRRSASFALVHYDQSLSGWGTYSFFIGLLPPCYVFSAMGMVSAMAEECPNPAIKLPRAYNLFVPWGGVQGLVFVLPICFTLPPLQDIVNAPAAQALPYIFHRVMGSPAGGIGLTSLVLVATVFCSISITVAASRTTWAFARDDAMPFAKIWAKVDKRLGVPAYGIVLLTVVQMLLGLINLGSSSAFTAFVSVGVIALAVGYAVPISLSLYYGRKEVSTAPWKLRPLFGIISNVVALLWIGFQLILFSMPVVLPVTQVSMNYASAVFAGFMALAVIWYAVYARKCKFSGSWLWYKADRN